MPQPRNDAAQLAMNTHAHSRNAAHYFDHALKKESINSGNSSL